MTDTAPEIRTVVVEREMPYPPEKIWRALTQPHLISEWLMKTDFALGPGEKFRLQGDWGGVDCEFLAIEPHSRLSYRWDHSHEEAAFDLRSVVTFTLSETDRGTLIRMEQQGFRSDQKQALGGAKYGWEQHLENLEKAVAKLD
ncbi:SRPBCC family protein [Pelagibacterium limicola]|uniref:SRPBCC family protein n=1 Tax=Pelagibacterium limicola TaxID=2791022 RepID=UPI0018B00C8F|nr:SRPBCC domain-containing protein [Pelagibacterium limicola]